MADLSQQQRVHLRKRLDERYDELLTDVRSELERSAEPRFVELAARINELGIEGLAEQVSGLNASLADREMAEMRDIEAARLRLRQGRYGDCIDCGEEIGYERLDAFPAAARCIDCQELHDTEFRTVAAPKL